MEGASGGILEHRTRWAGTPPGPARWLRLEDAPGRRGARWLQVGMARAVTTVYRRMLILTYALEGRALRSYHPALDVEIRPLETGDVAAYCRFRAARASVIRHRFAAGHRCMATWHRGEIVDAGWTAAGVVEVPYLHCQLLLAPGDSYHYDAYTAPGFRGGWLHMARAAMQAQWAREHGYRRSITLVAAENYRSWLVLTRAGLATQGSYSYLRIGPWRRYVQQGVVGVALPMLCQAARPPRARATQLVHS